MTDNRNVGAPRVLLPHQADFIDAFFATSRRFVLLRGDVGLGKGTALAALTARLLRDNPASRALVIAPAALQPMFVDQLLGQHASAVQVDRYRYREMLDFSSTLSMWPSGAAYVLSRDFARQSDVAASLASVTWDLLVYDDAHALSGLRAKAFHQVAASARRVLLSTATLSDLMDWLPFDDTLVVEWDRDRIVALVGRPVLREVSFAFSPEEQALSATVESLARATVLREGGSSMSASAVLRASASSPAALERVLRALRRPAESCLTQDPSSNELEDVTEDEVAPLVGTAGSVQEQELLERALAQTDEITTDSKLTAFAALLANVSDGGAERTICAVTQYLATLYYLAARLDEDAIVHHVVSGATSFAERLRVVDEASTGPSVLLATETSFAEGLSLSSFTDLILYDIPTSPTRWQQLVGRFDRIGRRVPLVVHVLAPVRPGGQGSQSLQNLRAVLDRPGDIGAEHCPEGS